MHPVKSKFKVKAETDGAVWILARTSFDVVRREAAKERRTYYYEFLCGIPVFQGNFLMANVE